MKRRRVALALVLFAAGCGGGGGGSPEEPAKAPFQSGGLDITTNGGGTSGTLAAAAGRGGNIDVFSDGNLLIGVNAPPLAPALPSPPTVGTEVASWTGIKTVASGHAFINGSIAAGTSGSEATLNVNGGDLVIRGSLTSADNGSVETNLVINVPAGTAWILGSIKTGRVDGDSDGDSAGWLRISAQRIIFTGSIDTRGENNEVAGYKDGGSVFFDTSGVGTGQTSQILVGGSIDMSGGDSSAFNALAGDGGSFHTAFPSPGSSSGAVHIFGTIFTSNGGSASGFGAVLAGNGGDLDLQGNAGVFFNGAFSAIGGNASSPNGDVTAGRGGGFFVNTFAISDSGPVAVFGSIRNSGGSANGADGFTAGGAGGAVLIRSGSDINLGSGPWLSRGADGSGRAGEGGDASFRALGDLFFDATLDVSDGSGALSVGGGAAGTIDFDTVGGDLMVSGSLTTDGGNGSDSGAPAGGPSDGGAVSITAGFKGGSMTIRAAIESNGGSDNDGADNPGGSGGWIRLVCVHPSGAIALDPGSSIQADGGDGSSGGNGGRIELLTDGGSIGDKMVGGNITLRGDIVARGGVGLAAGGLGGSVLADSDTGRDGRGGDITLHSGVKIDVSGGPPNGDAMNNGSPSVSSPAAVTFDADGRNFNSPSENGIVQNLGTIVARGAGSGRGGDIFFDGLNIGLIPGPAAGSLDIGGDGGDGNFLAR